MANGVDLESLPGIESMSPARVDACKNRRLRRERAGFLKGVKKALRRHDYASALTMIKAADSAVLPALRQDSFHRFLIEHARAYSLSETNEHHIAADLRKANAVYTCVEQMKQLGEPYMDDIPLPFWMDGVALRVIGAENLADLYVEMRGSSIDEWRFKSMYDALHHSLCKQNPDGFRLSMSGSLVKSDLPVYMPLEAALGRLEEIFFMEENGLVIEATKKDGRHIGSMAVGIVKVAEPDDPGIFDTGYVYELQLQGIDREAINHFPKYLSNGRNGRKVSYAMLQDAAEGTVFVPRITRKQAEALVNDYSTAEKLPPIFSLRSGEPCAHDPDLYLMARS